MILLPLGVLLLGYSTVWYGFCMVRGEGIGIMDVLNPRNIGKVDDFLTGSGKDSGTAQAPPYIPGSGVQPGSQYYPPNPNGGLPSKPPVGGTPPAYYG